MRKSFFTIMCLALLSFVLSSNVSAQTLYLNGESGSGIIKTATLNSGFVTFTFASNTLSVRIDWRQPDGSIYSQAVGGPYDYSWGVTVQILSNDFVISATKDGSKPYIPDEFNTPQSDYHTRHYIIQ